MNLKILSLGIMCLSILLIFGTSSVIADQPKYEWKCQMGDEYSWKITKLRKNNHLHTLEASFFGEEINITEGDTIDVKVLGLSESYVEKSIFRVKTEESEVEFRGWHVELILFSRNPLLLGPVAERGYYENQSRDNPDVELNGNLLTSQWTEEEVNSETAEVFLIDTGVLTVNIEKGLLQSFTQNFTLILDQNTIYDIAVNLIDYNDNYYGISGIPGFEYLGTIAGLSVIVVIPLIIRSRKNNSS